MENLALSREIPKPTIRDWLLLFLVTAPILGPYSLLGMALVLISYPLMRQLDLYQEYFEDVVQRDEKQSLQELVDEVKTMKVEQVQDALEILSYRQIMQGQDLDLKLNLISMLGFNPNKDNVRIIKAALYDEDETIRVLAGTALQKMDDFFVMEILECQDKLEKKESTRDQEVEIRFKLARLYRDYLFSGLVPGDSYKLYLEKMVQAYALLFQKARTPREPMLEATEALLQLRETEMAGTFLNLLDMPETDDLRHFLAKTRFHFQKREFEEVGVLLSLLDPTVRDQNQKVKDSVYWWMQEQD